MISQLQARPQDRCEVDSCQYEWQLAHIWPIYWTGVVGRHDFMSTIIAGHFNWHDYNGVRKLKIFKYAWKNKFYWWLTENEFGLQWAWDTRATEVSFTLYCNLKGTLWAVLWIWISTGFMEGYKKSCGISDKTLTALAVEKDGLKSSFRWDLVLFNSSSKSLTDKRMWMAAHSIFVSSIFKVKWDWWYDLCLVFAMRSLRQKSF